MNWQKLKESIHRIKPNEFEELVAALLTFFLKIPFVVARSGDQPSGDARSISGDVSMQAKRYTSKRTPNADTVEGDIRQVIRSLPHLQVYVLAVSRDTAQMRDRLDSISMETGLDIVILELSDDLSDLGALCVKFWDDIWKFFGTSDTYQDQEFLTWIGEMKNDAETEKKLVELKLKLEHGIQTQIHVQKDSEQYLLDRFSRDEGFNPINLSQSIERKSLESQIKHWWETHDAPVCCLEGEEGMGKTWLAAKWMNFINENENTAAFWLDSKDWTGSKSIFDLLYNCVSLIYPSSEQRKITKLQSKSAKIWCKTLIILDGVNEQNAIKTAQKILREFSRHESEWRDRIRFLLTTRPLDSYPDFEEHLWNKFHKISVVPFNEPELQHALIQKGLQPNDLPDPLKDIARIPRYFQTCIRLRNQFRSFDAVTKEMVLWADLLDKIKYAEQVRDKIDWQNVEDAEDILAKLATEAKWANINDAPKASAELLKECFPNYHEIRRDLEEQRIVPKAGKSQVELSEDHVVLGWAIHLSNLFDCKEYLGFKDFADSLQQELEPIPSEDLRTEALFLALQISVISPSLDVSQKQLSQKRAALMLAWFNSHNAQISEERISFWVEKDTDAYTQLVETKFRDQISPNEEDALIEPLAKIWRNKKGQLDHLQSRLTKWLLPTYADEVIIGDDNIDPEHLPFPTMDYTRIRLSTAALSILSQRPERHFLPTLAHCYVIHEEKPPFNENIGRLMRWGYTETVLGDLYWLAELSQRDDFLLDRVYGLVESLKLVELPKPLKRPLSEEDKEIRAVVEQWNSSFKPYISRIRDQEQLLKGDSPSANVEGNYHGLDYLAVRTDLPDLRDDDLVKIREVLHYISDNVEWGKSAAATLEDFCVKNLTPWLAKNNPQNYSEFACNFMINFLSPDYQAYLLRYVQSIIFHQNDSKRISEAILEMKECLTQNIESSLERARMFTEILLFNASQESLIDWFEFLAVHAPLRISICFIPISNLLGKLLPESILELAKEKFIKLRSSLSAAQLFSDNGQKELSEFEYWSALYAYGTQVNEKVATWAFDELRLRNPDSNATYPLLKITLSDSKRFLDEILTDEKIRKHLFCKESVKLILSIYKGKDVPSYEKLVPFLPTEIVGSFLCQPERRDDLSRWGKDLMKQMFSILQRDQDNINKLEEIRFTFAKEALLIWAKQNKSDFLELTVDFLTKLCQSPGYQQPLSNFTDTILCMLLRFQPETAMNFYQQWSTENVRTIYSNQYGIETFLAQLWKVEQCNSPKHVQLRRTLLEECKNDEEIMFMTIAAIAGGGEEELCDLVEKEYLESHYAKERNLGVSILPWFGTGKAFELLEDLKSNDPSRWVRDHAAWAYEVAQQERSCREVYREALRTRDLFRVSAVFEQIKPALSPTARWWHRQIEEEEFPENLQKNNPKMVALIIRFWYRWGNSSKTKRNVEIWKRKLNEYCRGEKLGSGSPPRLAPWWKPE